MFSKAAKKGAHVYSIDHSRGGDLRFVNYCVGWSISYEDIVKLGDKEFMYSRYDTLDGKVAIEGPQWMIGEKDLIRKVITKEKKLGNRLDFFFCDTGEYCGLAEWRIVCNEIVDGGFFAAHDIFYPKSIKSFKILCELLCSPQWRIIELSTESKQGLVIAQKQPQADVASVLQDLNKHSDVGIKEN